MHVETQVDPKSPTLHLFTRNELRIIIANAATKHSPRYIHTHIVRSQSITQSQSIIACPTIDTLERGSNLATTNQKIPECLRACEKSRMCRELRRVHRKSVDEDSTPCLGNTTQMSDGIWRPLWWPMLMACHHSPASATRAVLGLEEHQLVQDATRMQWL